MTTYIHQLPDWPAFEWDSDAVLGQLAQLRLAQGRMLGQMESLGFPIRGEATVAALTEEVLKSSDIEGETLARDQVRSSVAQRLGIAVGALDPVDRRVDAVVEMMLDATQQYAAPLTRERLFGWHSAVFPSGRGGIGHITVGAWRDDRRAAMEVVSGTVGRERVHYRAPAADRLDREMAAFITWFNDDQRIDAVIKSAIAHLWFVTIHPFDDGNGRIARAVAEMALARSEQSAQRFYSMSAQIREQRSEYYAILEATQKGSLDVTAWLQWFLDCLGRAIGNAERMLGSVLRKARFWQTLEAETVNARQRKVIDLLLGTFEAKLTSSKWSRITGTSSDTALRDINDLVRRGILQHDGGGGRSSGYALVVRE